MYMHLCTLYLHTQVQLVGKSRILALVMLGSVLNHEALAHTYVPHFSRNIPLINSVKDLQWISPTGIRREP